MSAELELIERAKAGSVNAFTELVHAYRDRLLRFLASRCTSFADAEDALQDTLINAYRYLHSYDARWRFSTWLYRIALRNAARLAPTPGDVQLEIPDESADPLKQCIADSERDNLWLTARGLLNDEVYTALWLRYAEDMSINDVAKVLDKTPAWTKVSLMRARNKLDAALASGEASNAYG